VIQTIIQEIEQQFRQHFEPFINPPATMQKIEEVEQKMGITFPDDVKTLYLTHDGEKDEGSGFFSASRFYC
jgi:internalin A